MTETRRTKVKRTQRWNMAHRCDARPPSDMRKTRSSCSYSTEVALGHKPVFLKCSSKDPMHKAGRAVYCIPYLYLLSLARYSLSFLIYCLINSLYLCSLSSFRTSWTSVLISSHCSMVAPSLPYRIPLGHSCSEYSSQATIALSRSNLASSLDGSNSWLLLNKPSSVTQPNSS